MALFAVLWFLSVLRRFFLEFLEFFRIFYVVYCVKALQRGVRICGFLQTARSLFRFSWAFNQVFGFFVFFLAWHHLLDGLAGS